jgi:ParB/RepB/Spo0J family partition protein
MFTPNSDVIVEIPLEQILADDEWNSRSGKWEVNDGDDESHQFDGLLTSIREKGQEEPCDVRIHPSKSGYYQLLAGFRRNRALRMIAAADKIEKPVMRCIVRNADDVQARVRNLSENATRQNISTPDLAWGIYQLHCAATTNGKPMTIAKIAATIGMSDSHVSHLLTIMSKCKPSITAKWRKMPKALSVLSMYGVALLPKADQDAAFAALLLPTEVSKDPTTESRKQGSWVDHAKAKAYSIGAVIGQLEAHNLIDTSDLDFSKHIDLIVPIREACTTVQWDMIVAQAEKGYKQGVRREKIPRIVRGK